MNYKNKIYLSGGLNSNWQESILQDLEEEFIFYNPRNHGLNEAKLYTTWDLYHIKIADIVFAYMESDNPSGYGLTLEIGYAAALNKTIILVDVRSGQDESFADKFRIVRESASVVFDDLEKAINYLKTFSNA